MTTFRVHLADAPTDVLVYLAENGSKTLAEVIAATSPALAHNPHATVIDALVLLRDMGVIERVTVRKPHTWRVTRSGAEAVAQAKQATDSNGAGEQRV